MAKWRSGWPNSMNELARIIDYKLPRTGMIVKRKPGGLLVVKWHDGEQGELSPVELSARYQGRKRFEIIPLKAHRGFRPPTLR